MNEARLGGSSQIARFAAADELRRFRGIQRLTNHWARPVSARSYYWYLTFENSTELQSLASRCQERISFPYYDLTPLNYLHMTIDRIAFQGEITSQELDAVEAAAKAVCIDLPQFSISIGALGGTPGAIGFTAFPRKPIQHLHDILRSATLSICPNAPTRKSAFHPHVAIAYCNSDVPATQAITAVEHLFTLRPVEVSIMEATLVTLERQQRAYSWQVHSRIPLSEK